MGYLNRRGFLLSLALPLIGCARSRRRVVLYCAQDQQFAESILDLFHEQTGLEAVPRFDSEANKSVGLYREIVAEQRRPRCDVFWNNEILGTIRLQERELLQSHASKTGTYPAWATGKDDLWHAFAARARVLLVNTNRLSDDHPRSLLDLTKPRYRNQVIMAKPQFGTTATQAACLFEVLGDAAARTFYKNLNANGLTLAPGNKQVAEWVGRGKTPLGKPAAIGLTDTDDALDEIAAGKPVKIIFPDSDAPQSSKMGTLFIPNTLCIPKGCPNPEGAKQLVDFLLSREVETRLAQGPSGQIPLNADVSAKLPPDIERGRKARAMRVDWTGAARKWDDVQKFLAAEFALK